MKWRKLMPLVVIAAGLLAYSNSFTGSYFHGDFAAILQNPTIRQLWPIWVPLAPPHADQIAVGLTVEGRPLINLSLAINYALGGYHVRGYHALNLAVHLLAGLTLLGIVRRSLLQLRQESRVLPGPAPIGSGPPLRERFGTAANELALAVAVLWVVHPLQTESVTYIIQRAESVMGLFYLLTLYCFIRGAESPRPIPWYVLSVTACASGMASKEVMVTAPVMVLLYDRAFLSRSVREAWRRRRLLYLALASTWILLGLVMAWGGNIATAMKYARNSRVSWWEYLATQPGVILYYLRLSVWPSPLRLVYQWPIAKTWMSILPPTTVVAALLAISVWAWRKYPVWGFVGAWFFLILAPSSSFVPLLDPIYEHRMYLSLAAVVSLVVVGLHSLLGRRSLAVFAAVAVGMGFLTWRRNQEYQRDPHFSLGLAYSRAGRVQEAMEEYTCALRTSPNDTQTHYNLALTLVALGRPQEAIEQYEQALELDPDYAEAHGHLGGALLGQGKVAEGMEHLEQALRLKPDYPEAHNDLGTALERAGQVPEAIAHYEQALRFKPDLAEAHYNLANSLFKIGQVQAAIGHWEQAVRFKPDFANAHYNLGSALERTGRAPEAIAHYEQALRLKPDFAEARAAFTRLQAVR